MLHEHHLDLRHVECDGEAVRLQGALAVAGIGTYLEALVEGVAETLSHPPDDLSDHTGRVDRLPDLLHHDVAEHRDLPGHRIDLDLGDVHVIRGGGPDRE